MKPLTPTHIYNDLYRARKTYLQAFEQLSEDKSSRLSNIYAVQNTWRVFTSNRPSALSYKRLLQYELEGCDG